MTTSDSLHLMRAKTEVRLREAANSTRGVIGLFVLDPSSGETFAINEHVAFPQASAIKIPVLMEVYKQAGEGKFKLSDEHRITKEEKTAGSGILAQLGEGTVRMTLHDLCVLMILVSDNTATNILIDLVGMENVNRTLVGLGLQQTLLRRRMMDMTAAIRGEENLSTPAEAVRIMDLLHRGEFLSRVASDEILAILKKPKASGIGAALPEGTVVASKPGGIPGVTTEWAIVYLKDRTYIAAFMESYGMKQEASEALKTVSKILYDHFLRLSHSTAHGTYVPPPERK